MATKATELVETHYLNEIVMKDMNEKFKKLIETEDDRVGR